MTNTFSFGLGGPRIRLLAADGTTEVTLTLPAPDQGGITQTLEESRVIDEMLDHSLSVTVHGYWHRYKVKYSVYDEAQTGLAVGVLDGNTPTVPQLQQILSQYRPGRIQFSPSTTAAFYPVYFDKMPVITPVSDMATGYEFEVRTINLHASLDNSSAKVLA